MIAYINVLGPSMTHRITEEQLEEAATESGVLHMSDDFLPPEVRTECQRIIPDFENIRPNECNDAYLYLKSKFSI